MRADSRRDPIDPDVRIAALVKKGRQAQNAPNTPDWSLTPRKPFWLPGRAVAVAVSQFYYGERTTAELCERIAHRITDAEARSFLATQIADERRHAEFFRRYAAGFGGLAPASAALESAYAAAREWDGPPEALILAIHVVLEGENLNLQQTVDSWLPCPLFADISRCVARDEARHRAFGDLYLRGEARR